MLSCEKNGVQTDLNIVYFIINDESDQDENSANLQKFMFFLLKHYCQQGILMQFECLYFFRDNLILKLDILFRIRYLITSVKVWYNIFSPQIALAD